MLAVAAFALLVAIYLLMQSEVGPILIVRPAVMGPLVGAAIGLPEPGLVIGVVLEWIWADRIPAGGLRTPAVPVATAAALTILFALDPAGTPPDGRTLTMAIGGGLLALVLFVPLDGGLRRLWGLAGENVVRALEQGSIGELRAFAPTALVLRVGAVTAGLTAIAWAFRELDVRLAVWPVIDRLGALPWAFVVLGAMAALIARNPLPAGEKLPWWAPLGFLAGWGLSWLR